MKSKSFTNQGTKFKKIKQILPSFCIEERYPEYTNIENFNQNITDPKILKYIESNLNNSLNLFYKDSRIATNTSINIIDTLKQQMIKNQAANNNLSTLELLTALKDYGLSSGQANYIALSSTQGGVGKSNILDHMISKIGLDATLLIHRESALSQLIIDHNKNVQYIGGQAILFDHSQTKYLDALQKGVGIENYLLHLSHDRVIVYITVSLGQLGQNLAKKSFAMRTDVAGQGEMGSKILAEFNAIKSTCQDIDPEEVLINYIEFSEQTLYRDKMQERHELMALITPDEKAEHKNVSNHIAPEDLATLLTIQAVNVPDKQKVELILKEGADPNYPDQNQNTILHIIALEQGDCEVAQSLLEYGANPNITNQDGDTPLHIAVRKHYSAMVLLLLNKGADANITNKQGVTCYHLRQGDIKDDVELQEFNDFILKKQSCNISLHSFPIIEGAAEAGKASIVGATNTNFRNKYFSSWNLFKKNHASANQCLMNVSNNIPNNASSCWYTNQDILLSDDFAARHEERSLVKSRRVLSNNACKFISEEYNTNLIEVISDLVDIVQKVASCTITSDKILKLKEIFTNTSINNRQEEFILKLGLTLSDHQLHHLNTIIMQTMHQLLPEEDTICFLRSSEDKIFRDLLLLEAKRHNMIVTLPNSLNDEVILPQIPAALLDLYATLKDHFYNQATRASQEPVEQRIAKSIHWLFINPLISKHCIVAPDKQMLVLELLKLPGKYTELLIQNNIAGKIVHKSDEASQLLTTKELNKFINNILQIYISDFTHLIVEEISNSSKIDIKQLNKDELSSKILGHLQMSCNLQILLFNNKLILDEISNFIKTLYAPKDTQNSDLLAMFLHNFIPKMDLENQIITEKQELKHPVTKITSPFEVTLQIKKFTEDKDYRPLIEIKDYQEFIQHLKKYYGVFLGPQLVEIIISSYSASDKDWDNSMLNDIQSELVILGNNQIINWLIQYEGLKPMLLLDKAIYHYALPGSDQSTTDHLYSIIQHILTDQEITNYFTLEDTQILLSKYKEAIKDQASPLDSKKVSTILSVIKPVPDNSWSKQVMDLLAANNIDLHIDKAEDVSFLGAPEDNIAKAI